MTYRDTDPQTSVVAADRHERSGRRSERREQVLDLVRRFPGMTSGELAREFLEVHPHLGIRVAAETPHKRLPELERLGLVYRARVRTCGDSGCPAATWIAVLQQGELF